MDDKTKKELKHDLMKDYEDKKEKVNNSVEEKKDELNNEFKKVYEAQESITYRVGLTFAKIMLAIVSFLTYLLLIDFAWTIIIRIVTTTIISLDLSQEYVFATAIFQTSFLTGLSCLLFMKVNIYQLYKRFGKWVLSLFSRKKKGGDK